MNDVVPAEVLDNLRLAAKQQELDIEGGNLRRSSSRFCLGVEHGDYNGTELFGVGTDRFIWLAWKPNGLDVSRMFSLNFPDDGVVTVAPHSLPESNDVKDSWARFPAGVASILNREGIRLQQGIDVVLTGNIPGGGMSRSASLTLNLILTMMEANGLPVDRSTQSTEEGLRIVELAQAVENDYIGSPCGNLDQIMIYFARSGRGTHYSPARREIKHVPLGASDFRLVSLDTGTDRPGLEKSTYKIRREECEQLVELARPDFGIECLADVKTAEMYDAIRLRFQSTHSDLCRRLKYIYEAQGRFEEMLQAWKDGDLETLGRVFRLDGYGLRDDYVISGPELESMCEIARTVDGVLGERMLGGGDKGAAGAIVETNAVDTLEAVVSDEYPRQHPEFADRFAVHSCGIVDGITDFPGVV